MPLNINPVTRMAKCDVAFYPGVNAWAKQKAATFDAVFESPGYFRKAYGL